jgi:2-amino-4-hydroxy-6-hydroxymethyldihydropteridine diphosphokinase
MAEELAFVALGSNLGDSRQITARAIGAIQLLTDAPLLQSALWKTVPVDCPPGSPSFVNAVVALRPRAADTPHTLWRKLQALEKEFGRQSKSIPNEPRPLDLDLIAFGSWQISSSELTLPHPRAHLRRFVLQPLSEIAPNLILRGQSKTVSELLRSLGAERDQPGCEILT